MDVFLLNNNFEPINLIEGFSSLIWTERYNDEGDVELLVPEDKKQQSGLIPGRFLYTPKSDRLMMIKKTERKESGHQNYMKVSGNSLETLLREKLTSIESSGKSYSYTGSAGFVATRLVRRVCVSGSGYSTRDVIPNLSVTAHASSTTEMTFDIPVEPLYNSVKNLCDMDDLGFRILYDHKTKDLTFRAYRGTDRSIPNVTHPYVFSADYDNLHSISYVRSIENYKTVAYVTHPDRNTIVTVNRPGYGEGDGITRRVLLVNASDIEDVNYDKMVQRGLRELAEYNRTDLLDGEIRRTNNMVYGQDFGLGDIVELRSPESGIVGKAMVIEHVWTTDNQGFRSYPTLKALDQ